MANAAAGRIGRGGEDCLEAILALAEAGPVVRVKDLAERLGVSRPSVVAALSALEERELVRHERYGGVELTGTGRRLASEVSRRHRLLQGFLEEQLGVSTTTAAEDACRMEHVLSQETVRQLVGFVQRTGRVERVVQRTGRVGRVVQRTGRVGRTSRERR